MADRDRTSDTDESGLRSWQRVSLSELLMWFVAISVALAIPIGFNLPLLPAVFYGTLGALTWRLSQAMPVKLALLIAFVLAAGFTYLLVVLEQQ